MKRIRNTVRSSLKVDLIMFLATKGDFGTEVEKISVNYADHSYVICSSNNKLHIVKKNVSGEVYA